LFSCSEICSVAGLDGRTGADTLAGADNFPAIPDADKRLLLLPAAMVVEDKPDPFKTFSLVA